MNAHESSDQGTSDCIGLKVTVCQNGVINVKRPESDRGHSVFVDGEGEVLRCSCKGHKFHGHCVHQDEIGTRPLVRSSAVAAATETSQQIATDGGTTQVSQTDDDSDDDQTDKGTDCPECHAEGTVTYEPQPGSDTIPTYVCANCDYSTFTLETDTGETDTADRQADDNDGENRPQTDYWDHEVEHFDDGPVGAGEKSECQSCGARFDVSMIAATAENTRNWEEFYECQSCGARGSFRFHGETDRREWTGRIAYPD